MEKIWQYNGNQNNLDELKGFIRGMGLELEIKENKINTYLLAQTEDYGIEINYNKKDLFEIKFKGNKDKVRGLERKIGEIFNIDPGNFETIIHLCGKTYRKISDLNLTEV